MDFKDTKAIKLKVGSEGNQYGFVFTAAETATGTGALPHNTTIASATVATTDSDGTTVTSFCTITSTTATTITVSLDYPDAGVGLYSLVFTITLNTGDVWIKQFDRVNAL